MEKQGQDALLDEGMRKWIARTARARAWQVRDYDADDLIQEGYMCYVKCRDKYGHNFSEVPTKGERRWFMALVKRAFLNRLTSLQRQHLRRPPIVSYEAHVPDERRNDSLPAMDRILDDGRNVDYGMQGFVDILLSAPVEVLQIVTKIAEDGHVALSSVTREASRLTLASRKHKRLRYRETTNEQLCKLVGADPRVKNIHREILDLLEKT